ncbi:hypothetical protein SPLC1_S206910 [Arthrospira platensis C1]|nr:hypothetical protein SPLC1_S206910 [Arthrospira platensis C1]
MILIGVSRSLTLGFTDVLGLWFGVEQRFWVDDT